MAMARLLNNTQDVVPLPPSPRPLRILAVGTLFLTHTLSLPALPSPSSVTRAHSVSRTRGGSASCLLSLLAQFNAAPGLIDPQLVAPLGGNEEGKMIMRELEREGVGIRYCKIWKGVGVPSAWVLQSADPDTRSIINHNPLPDISHEEFVALLGPLLAPENYFSGYPSPTSSPIATANPSPPPTSAGPSRSPQHIPSMQARLSPNPNSPAPFDWLHFEGRSVKATLNNLVGIDSLARERKWRSHCVFSLDVGRKGRQGVEALIPHADIIFLNYQYAASHSPPNTNWTPRAFLLSLTSIAAPHALLVAHWGREGAAALSLPTKEYFQSSGWVSTDADDESARRKTGEGTEVVSVRSGSDFWAAGLSRTPSASEYTDRGSASIGLYYNDTGHSRRHARGDSNDSEGTEIPDDDEVDGRLVDEAGSQDAFVAGMIYALSRRMMPGAPYTPGSGGVGENGPSPRDIRPGTSHSTSSAHSDESRWRWRLDECLRFATELAGRKARRRGWEGLAVEMGKAGWFDS